MSITLTSDDFCPLAEFQFQHWHERPGEPFAQIRPLTDVAAERMWARAMALSGFAWDEGPSDDALRLDLRADNSWTDQSVSNWLIDRIADREQTVIVCYQPRVAIAIPWGALCDHWLTILWTAGCAWPLDESWILVHDGDVFALGRRGS